MPIWCMCECMRVRMSVWLCLRNVANASKATLHRCFTFVSHFIQHSSISLIVVVHFSLSLCVFFSCSTLFMHWNQCVLCGVWFPFPRSLTSSLRRRRRCRVRVLSEQFYSANEPIAFEYFSRIQRAAFNSKPIRLRVWRSKDGHGHCLVARVFFLCICAAFVFVNRAQSVNFCSI